MATEHAAEQAGGQAAEHVTGMPQLDFSTFPSQIFWSLVALVALFFMLSRIAIPRIAGVLEDRHEAIANDLEAAADLKKKAEQAEEAYNKALADARSEAQRIAAETKADIQKDLDAAIAKADAEIAAKSAESEERILEIRQGAQDAIVEVANEAAVAIIASLVPGAGDEKAVKKAVTAAMKG